MSLLAHEPVDRAWLGERLDLDLSGVGVDVIDDLGVTAASEAYDLFVNASYLSWDASRARHGLFVVHFPVPGPAAERPAVAGPGPRAAGRAGRGRRRGRRDGRAG